MHEEWGVTGNNSRWDHSSAVFEPATLLVTGPMVRRQMQCVDIRQELRLSVKTGDAADGDNAPAFLHSALVRATLCRKEHAEESPTTAFDVEDFGCASRTDGGFSNTDFASADHNQEAPMPDGGLHNTEKSTGFMHRVHGRPASGFRVVAFNRGHCLPRGRLPPDGVQMTARRHDTKFLTGDAQRRYRTPRPVVRVEDEHRIGGLEFVIAERDRTARHVKQAVQFRRSRTIPRQRKRRARRPVVFRDVEHFDDIATITVDINPTDRVDTPTHDCGGKVGPADFHRMQIAPRPDAHRAPDLHVGEYIIPFESSDCEYYPVDRDDLQPTAGLPQRRSRNPLPRTACIADGRVAPGVRHFDSPRLPL